MKLKLEENENKTIYYTDPGFLDVNVKMAFSTRLGGYSLPPYNSLNLGYTTKDSEKSVLKNRIKFLEALDMDVFGGILAGQVHGKQIKVVDNKINDAGLLIPGINIPDTDGLITNKTGLALAGTFADCVPLFFFEPEKKVIAISHAGWKGTRENIAGDTIKTMYKKMGTKVDNIRVIIGPSIGRCCYEVGEDIDKAFKVFNYYREIFSRVNKKTYLDLWLTNYIQLEEEGILPQNILVSDICSACYNDLLFSYRKEKGITGRMMGLIMLK